MTDAARALALAEAIASTSSSHEPGCVCLACRAARGDQRAAAVILEYVATGLDYLDDLPAADG